MAGGGGAATGPTTTSGGGGGGSGATTTTTTTMSGSSSSLEEAAAIHWQSLGSLNHALSPVIHEVIVSNTHEIMPRLVTNMPTSYTLMNKAPETLLLMGQFSAPKFTETAKNQVAVYMCLLRLAPQSSDILIILNNPTAVNPNSSSAKSFLAPNSMGALALFQQVVKSFKIEDWSLFP